MTKAHLDAIVHTCQVPVPHPVARVALLPLHLCPSSLAFQWVEQGEGGREEGSKKRLGVSFTLEGSAGEEDEGGAMTVQLFWCVAWGRRGRSRGGWGGLIDGSFFFLFWDVTLFSGCWHYSCCVGWRKEWEGEGRAGISTFRTQSTISQALF